MRGVKDGKRQRGVLSQGECVLAAGLIVLLAFLTLAGGRSFLRVAETDRFEAASAAALRAVGERVIEMRGVMKSMLGMHYASDEFGGVDIEAFAEQLRAYSPFVRSIGMFGAVDGSLREDYERYHTESSGVPFVIHAWTGEGETSERSGERYLPVRSVDPLDAIGRRFLGTDLGSVSAIAVPLWRTVASGEGIVTDIPAGWPIEGDALLLQPVYLSAEPPADEAERLETHLGGIWIAIDLASALQGAFEDLPEASIELLLDVGSEKPRSLFGAAGIAGDEGIDLAFGQGRDERTWMIGESRLTMRVRAPLRASAEDVSLVLFCALVAMLLGTAATAVVYQQRVVRRERALGTEALEIEREKAKRTLESISDAVIAIDADGKCRYVNPSAMAWFALDAEHVAGMPFVEAMRFRRTDDGAPLELAELVAAVGTEEAGRHVVDVQVSAARRADSTYKLTFSRMAVGAAGSSGFILVLQNVSREREMTAELERRAHHDSLTGCYNRFYFEKHLRELVAELDGSERRHALCYIDLDKFKIVNDTCGHPAGDRLLRELAKALTMRLRSKDVLARLGGDEFGVILCDVSEENAVRIAERLFEHFSNAVFESDEGDVFPVRASMGLVEIGERNRDFKQIMKAADIACYEAKNGGRNALVVYTGDGEAASRQTEETNWFTVLERALEDGRFELLVQPVLRLGESERARHHEFLLRFVDERGELVLPGQFMRAAERYDLMRAIDRWVIERAIGIAAGTESDGASFSINLCARSLSDPELLPFITDALKRRALDPGRLWFEITEAAAIKQFTGAAALCEGLRALGARIALDDFGAEMSSFACLRDLPVDVLKLDGQFVRDVARDPLAREMVRAMHLLARARGLETVAEMVEDAETLAAIEALEIDYAQGWAVGRPGTVAEVLEGCSPSGPASAKAA